MTPGVRDLHISGGDSHKGCPVGRFYLSRVWAQSFVVLGEELIESLEFSRSIRSWLSGGHLESHVVDSPGGSRKAVDDQDRKQWLEVLRSTPSRLKALLEGVPRSVALWAPAPGKWSILEIVCHMRDMEREAYLARYERILAEDEPRLPDVDGDVYSLELDYRAEALVPALREWARLRRESLRLLSRVKGPGWDRAGVHETAGRLSMAGFLRRHAVGNDEAHLGQIEAIKRRHALLARLEGAPARLAKALGALPAEAVRRPPEPGQWAPVEIACHLRDADRVSAERVSKMAFSDRPTLWMMDNARLAERLRYREADLQAVLKEHRRRREGLVSLLRALPDGAWQRTGIHPKRGELTIEALAGLVADHDDGHLSRIEAQGRTYSK
jgi:hypothetical protein